MKNHISKEGGLRDSLITSIETSKHTSPKNCVKNNAHSWVLIYGTFSIGSLTERRTGCCCRAIIRAIEHVSVIGLWSNFKTSRDVLFCNAHPLFFHPPLLPLDLSPSFPHKSKADDQFFLRYKLGLGRKRRGFGSCFGHNTPMSGAILFMEKCGTSTIYRCHGNIDTAHYSHYLTNKCYINNI